MMSGRKVDYFVSQQTAPPEADCVLVGLDARYVPYLLRIGLTQLSRSVWLSDEDYARGYQGTLAWMEAILMDCGTAIVNNIIALRGIPLDAPRDATTGVPVGTFTGSTLTDIYSTGVFDGRTTANLLTEIELHTERNAQATEDGLLTDENVALLAQLLAII